MLAKWIVGTLLYVCMVFCDTLLNSLSKSVPQSLSLSHSAASKNFFASLSSLRTASGFWSDFSPLTVCINHQIIDEVGGRLEHLLLSPLQVKLGSNLPLGPNLNKAKHSLDGKRLINY